ncbi:MAG: ATP-binding cassette domain-containing protein [Candidatus Omnitrophica bacterium]|nr:ATP-binding cassette domain-containing protein [Candidatus Omnitrophota bacterium]
MISLINVSKKFIIPENKRGTLLKSIISNIVGQSAHKTIWALDKVTLDIKRGETVGLIGQNGSGKSTLLRIVQKIYEPTSGSLKVQGDVASVLHLDTVFFPDLSLRDNIFLFGTIMGMDRKGISKNLSRIMDFAELNEFFYAAVRTLSSGMKQRLAFSVILHACKDILLFDEIFAERDQRFKQKCFGIIEGLKKEGKTILFTSHDLNIIKRFCDRVFLLQNGRIVASGDADEIIQRYADLLLRTDSDKSEV